MAENNKTKEKREKIIEVKKGEKKVESKLLKKLKTKKDGRKVK